MALCLAQPRQIFFGGGRLPAAVPADIPIFHHRAVTQYARVASNRIADAKEGRWIRKGQQLTVCRPAGEANNCELGEYLGFMRSLLIALLVATHGAGAQTVTGKVVSVHDGDTITVLVDRRQVKVRLAEIDAPELGQAFGARSRQALAAMCAGKDAQVIDRGKDRYERTIGRVICAGVDANAEQVRRGWAWVFIRYAPKNSPLYSVEAEARAEKRGLWADPEPVPPWEWRKRGLRSAPISSGDSGTTRTQ